VRTVFNVAFISPRGANETWMVRSAELSDATGNLLRDGEGGSPYYILGAPLPNEAAWRLKLEIKRSFGFSPEEVVTFEDVPVPGVGTTATNHITKTVGGVSFELREFKRRPDINDGRPAWQNTMNSSIHFEIHAPAHGVAVGLLRIRTDTGASVEPFVPPTPPFVGAPWAEGDYAWPDTAQFVAMKSIPGDAKTLDLTWVVQKTRSVEFFVKPPKGE
jgi:hypothetical protein